MSQSIAFFDFDGTITTKDTLLEFIKFYKGTFRFYLGFIINSPYLVAFKLKIIANHTAKQKVLSYFFRGEDINDFQQKCDAFAKDVLPKLIRPKAVKEIEALKEKNIQVVIVSASAENWIKQWSDSYGLLLMGTRLQTINHSITGYFEGQNCHGEEKVRRIKEQYNLQDYMQVLAYGDSSGDKPMLQLAHHSFYKPFR